MTVNITDTKKDKIIVHEFDKPELLAKDFISKYNLNPKLVQPLTEEIRINLSSLYVLQKEPSDEVKHPTRSQSKSKVPETRQKFLSQEEKELTFKPKINPVSDIIAQRMSNRSQDSIRRKEYAMAKFQIEKNAEEMSACTFAPKINPKSSKILQHKQRPGTDKFSELYEDAYARKLKQETLERQIEFSFRPEILQRNNISSTGDRLYEKKASEESRQNDMFDPETGQEFFIPKINNEVKYQRYREVPIGEHLYRQQKFNREMPESVNSNPTFEAKVRTEKLMNMAKRKRYRDVFNQLNPDDRDIISYSRIDKRMVEPVAWKLMQPLLDELRDEDETLDFEQFYNSMDNLLKILAPDERNVFLICKRNKDENSVGGGSKRSLAGSEASGVYYRQVEKRLGAQARIELEREKKARNELDGCTFHPQTTPYYKIGKGIDIE